MAQQITEIELNRAKKKNTLKINSNQAVCLFKIEESVDEKISEHTKYKDILSERIMKM